MTLKRIHSLLIIFISIAAIDANSANLSSNISEEIFEFIKSKLVSTNATSETGVLLTWNDEQELWAASLKLSYANQMNKQTVQTDKIRLKIMDKSNSVGYIDFKIGKGVPIFLSNEKTMNNNSYNAYLDYFEIYQAFQGKGLSPKAMKLFHDFLGNINISFVYLVVASKMPHTASIYKKSGYQFSEESLQKIKNWWTKNRPSEDIPSEDSANAAVDAFLKDSSVNLGTVGAFERPYMIKKISQN